MAQTTTVLNGDATAANTLVQFNPATQLPIKLTGSSNFATWKAQISMLMNGHDLIGHLDGTKPAPAKTLTRDNATIPNPAYHNWFRQDQLIQNALMVSVDPTLASTVATSPTANAAWQTLHTTFANRSQTRIFSLRDQLARLQKDSLPITTYLHNIKTIANELATAGSPMSNAELIVKILSGLGSEFREISAAIRSRETEVTYEELYEKLVDHELFLQHDARNRSHPTPVTAAVAQNQSNPRPSRPSNTNYSRRAPHDNSQYQTNRNQQPRPRRNNAQYTPSNDQIRCQLCDRPGHTARVCRSQSHDHFQAQANYAGYTHPQSDQWIIDTGATHHIVSDAKQLTTINDFNGTEEIAMGNGDTIPISHTGNIEFNASNCKFQFNNTLCSPSITNNLMSVSQFCRDNNKSIEFFPYSYVVKDMTTGAPLVRGECRGRLYRWPPSNTIPSCNLSISSDLWHQRLGHPNLQTLNSILNKFSLPKTNSKFSNCNACNSNKMHRLPFSKNSLTSDFPLQLIYSDLWGPSPIISIDKKRYYVLFVDQFTRYMWLYTLQTKNEVLQIFSQLHPLLERRFKTKIETLYTDGGGEFLGLDAYLKTNGIEHLISTPYTPQRVAIVERRHRHILETAKTLLHQASMSSKFWSYACQYAAYLINRLPSTSLNNKSPYEQLFNESPNYKSLKVFGCLCYPWLKPYAKNKLEPKSKPCLYLGFSTKYHSHQCFEPQSSKIYMSRDVVFFEKIFPCAKNDFNFKINFDTLPWDYVEPQPLEIELPQNPSCLNLPEPIPIHSATTLQPRASMESGMHSYSPLTLPSPPTATKQPSTNLVPYANTYHRRTKSPSSIPNVADSTPIHATINPNNLRTQPEQATITEPHTVEPTLGHNTNPVPSTAPTNPDNQSQITTLTAPNPTDIVTPTAPPTAEYKTHPPTRMVTRSQTNSLKPRQFHVALTPNPDYTPRTYKQAQKSSHWKEAMQIEYDALIRNKTWSLVPSDSSQNVVDCKWLFRIKYNSDGSIDRYKARLVAKGFTQRPGLDYHSTFSPVVKSVTIRLVLTIATQFSWHIHQLDVNNAFLQSNLEEEVYMRQPPGFESTTMPSHICRMHKAIYGLKQAPRAWYTALKNYLVEFGFTTAKSDSSLFILNQSGFICYVLVYVDDIIVTGNQSARVQGVIAALSSKFSIKDLGDLHYFLGVEVTYDKAGMLLSQQKYILDVLEEFNMIDCKGQSTPMSATIDFSIGQSGENDVDATMYRRAIGKLHYLQLTRPDIAFAVNKLSQFMHLPNAVHWRAAKRVLRYLHNTSTMGLRITRERDRRLLTYSDSDWAGDPLDRTSTTGYIVYFGSTPISWSSKKQRSVSRSSTEAEYRAVAAATSETNWIQHLLAELGVPLAHPPVIHCDNVSTTYICANPVFHSRMKHVGIDFHFVREQVQRGTIKVVHLHSADQVADILTKPLPQAAFNRNLSKLGLVANIINLRGRNTESTSVT